MATFSGKFWVFQFFMILGPLYCMGSLRKSDGCSESLRIAQNRSGSLRIEISVSESRFRSQKVEISKFWDLCTLSPALSKNCIFCWFSIFCNFGDEISHLVKLSGSPKTIDFHWKSMISLKSMDFMIFMMAIIVEPPPQPIRELNRPRKRTFRKHLETSDKKYSTYLTSGGRSTLVVSLVRARIIKDIGFHWKSMVFLKSMDFMNFKDLLESQGGDHRVSTAPVNYRVE